jgi:23S rRNA (guanosine2251-2'-O)-methyltransferase
MKSISSDSNPNFRRWLRLADSPRAVREQGSTLAEGLHLAGAIADAGVAVGAVLVRRGASEGAIPALLDRLGGEAIAFELAAPLYDRLSPVEHGAGLMVVIGIAQREAPRRRDEDLVYLDGIQDPGNAGAILRCAAAFGVAGVITQDRNAPDETGALAKAASGALETIPLLRAVNIARTLIALKAAGFWVVGLDASGTPLSGPAMADRRIALVLGAEGDGMRRLTRETCDVVAGLAMPGIKPGAVVDSLNVSAAAAVALYELGRRG